MLIGHRKGKTVKDRLACNFGCAHPEGYRKALSEDEALPRSYGPSGDLSFIDTPGAYPGIGAEERGQSAARLPRNHLRDVPASEDVPIVCHA